MGKKKEKKEGREEGKAMEGREKEGKGGEKRRGEKRTILGNTTKATKVFMLSMTPYLRSCELLRELMFNEMD